MSDQGGIWPILQSGDHFGETTAWSLIYFLNYACLDIYHSLLFSGHPLCWEGSKVAMPTNVSLFDSFDMESLKYDFRNMFWVYESSNSYFNGEFMK